jgi:ATP-dependent Clp protease ATP-binding subunit ClpA
MRTIINSPRTRKTAEGNTGLDSLLGSRIVGQPTAVGAIVPYVQMYQAGLAPEGRPAGVFLLMGPSGTGKTKTVEALAGALHGSEKNILKVDCGEFQMEHEVAKLIGAPPGYLGHRETQPMLTQAKLNGITSDRSSLAIVLFDEIEKAAPSMTRLLLGVLDKATLRLGDNNVVNFERSLIFMTSNLGAREMMREMNPDFGFQSMTAAGTGDVSRKLERIGMHAIRRRFSPEFINRIDAVVTYQPLTKDSLGAILDHQLTELQSHIDTRLGARAFSLGISDAGQEFLLDRGTSSQYGARELKRTIHRQLTQPIAALVADGKAGPGGTLQVDLALEGDRLEFTFVPDPAPDEEMEEDDFELPPPRTSRGLRRSILNELPRRPPKAA